MRYSDDYPETSASYKPLRFSEMAIEAMQAEINRLNSELVEARELRETTRVFMGLAWGRLGRFNDAETEAAFVALHDKLFASLLKSPSAVQPDTNQQP